MVDHASSIRKINWLGQRAKRETGLIETLGYIMCDREEGANGGVVRSEAMLGRG